MPQGAIQEDRRKFPRVDVEIKGIFRVIDSKTKDGLAEIQNVSLGGVMFISSSPLQSGGLIEMTLFLKGSEISHKANVVWAEKVKGLLAPECQYGIEFVTISPLERRYLSFIISSDLEKNRST